MGVKMKMYIKQRAYETGEVFGVFDENEYPRFKAESDLTQPSTVFRLYDMNDIEMHCIRKTGLTSADEYEILKNDVKCAVVRHRSGQFHSNIELESRIGDFLLTGDLFGLSFDIIKNGLHYGSICKKNPELGESYEVLFQTPEDAPFLCALVITIDRFIQSRQ